MYANSDGHAHVRECDDHVMRFAFAWKYKLPALDLGQPPANWHPFEVVSTEMRLEQVTNAMQGNFLYPFGKKMYQRAS